MSNQNSETGSNPKVALLEGSEDAFTTDFSPLDRCLGHIAVPLVILGANLNDEGIKAFENALANLSSDPTEDVGASVTLEEVVAALLDSVDDASTAHLLEGAPSIFSPKDLAEKALDQLAKGVAVARGVVGKAERAVEVPIALPARAEKRVPRVQSDYDRTMENWRINNPGGHNHI